MEFLNEVVHSFVFRITNIAKRDKKTSRIGEVLGYVFAICAAKNESEEIQLNCRAVLLLPNKFPLKSNWPTVFQAQRPIDHN